MSMKQAITILLGLALSPAANADVIENIGRELGAGAVEKIQPALVGVLADAETRAIRVEDHFGTIAGGLIDKVDAKAEGRLDQVNRILEARLLQATIGAREVTDRALSGVDLLVKGSLLRARHTAGAVIKDLEVTADRALLRASGVLKDRIADVGREVNGAIDKADRALAERIDQVDEAIGRRLGNVDVIASKQRVAIEETAVRTAVLLGFVVFTVFLLLRLYARYAKLTGRPSGSRTIHQLSPADGDPARGNWGPRGGARTMMFARGLGVPLLGHLVVAAIGTGVLFLLYDWLPMGARKQAAELISNHQTRFSDSLDRFDFARARFHASQLEYLDADDAITRGALIAKADLLRDVFARPTSFGTEAGIAALWKQLREMQQILGPHQDPDLLVVEAMLVWHTGDSRRDELRAASLCARALHSRRVPGGFALAPLARAYIETFVDAPYSDEQVGLGRNSYALDDLRAVLDHAPAPSAAAHPLAPRIQLMRLMREVDAKSSTAYVETIRRHTEVVAAIALRVPAAEVAAARDRRTAAAGKVLAAWSEFDTALAAMPDLARDPSTLVVFRLNDALYARAKWFFDDPATDKLPPRLVAPPAARGVTPRDAADLTTRLQMAPPRIVWTRRYQRLIDGPARQLFELQEIERFAVLEAAASAFEQAMIDMGPAPDAIASDEPVPEPRRKAAQAAAALGLYVSERDGTYPRVPFARVLVRSKDKAVDEAMLGRGIRLL